jgi:DUF4097 and DUF4098 domain-containing protein YvlB
MGKDIGYYLGEVNNMKKQFLIFAVILLLIAVELTGCLGLVSKDFNSDVEADENTILNVTNINGKIEINSWDSTTISVDAKTSSNQGNDELEKIKINVIESNNVVNIETEYLGTGTVEASTDMVIKVPTFVSIDKVTSSNGDVKVTGTKGNTTAHSSNGAVTIADVDGYVSASSSNGDIEVKGTTGISDLDTSNGEIYAEIFSFNENISISTSNGEITVYINPLLNADIEMKTSNGRISISEVLLNLTISEEDYKVGKLGDGGNKLDMLTSNGDIGLVKLNI